MKSNDAPTSIGEMNFRSGDPLTQEIVESGLVTWEDLVRAVRNFSYGRNTNRHDFTLVWRERKGTCSSKHAFLKHVASLNNRHQVQLFLGIYEMTGANTPSVQSVLTKYDLEALPEAHCYLKVEGKYMDCTFVDSNVERIQADILEEIEISPPQVGDFKVDYHRRFLKKWTKEQTMAYSFDALWSIREECIEAMST